MDNQTLQSIKDLISKSDNIAIAVGKNPTVDTMASALALQLSLEGMNKQPTIVSATQPLVEHSNLVGIDKVKTRVAGSGNGDLIVSFPYREGEIEKVSYTIDNDMLNIVVKAGENGLNFSEKDVIFNRGGGTVQLLFVIGTPHMSDIANLFPADGMKDVQVVNVDNKEENEGYGTIVLVSPRFSSVSEQTADLLLSLGMDFDLDAAQNLMHGITAATRNFQDFKTSYLAFEIAGILMKKGARRIRENNNAVVQPREERRPQPQPQQQQFTPRVQDRPQQDRPHLNRPQQERPITQRSQPQPRPQPHQNQNAQQPHPVPPNPQRPQPVQEQRSQSPVQQQQHQDTPPADWLAPKVYKGSTNI